MDVQKLKVTYDEDTGRKIINGQYRIVRKIGQGSFGKVLLGQVIDHRECKDEFVAVKTINRIDKSQLMTKAYISQATKIKREIQIMKETNHPNIVKLYQVIDDLKFDKILLILEYCKFGEIDWKSYNHYAEKYQPVTSPGLTINKILRDVCLGLQYLHKCKIIHRDLKPSNLLINHDNTVKISDFGVSLILQNNTKDDTELGKIVGTPAFFAPELCQFVNNRYSTIDQVNNDKIDERIDLWSLGVILYCLIFHDLPFNGCNEYELFKNIVSEQLKFPAIKQSSKVTTNDLEELTLLKDLIKKLLCKNPKDRITLEEVKRHSFTVFDLSSSQRRKFLTSNQTDPGTGLSGKLKKMFISSPKPVVLQPTVDSTSEPKTMDSEELQPVDDLLDSYLDDSSSYGSDVEELEDTTNILYSLNDNVTESKVKMKPPPLKLSDSTFAPPSTINAASGSQSGLSSPNMLSDSSSNSTKKASQLRAPVTPTNNSFVTIGAASPSSSIGAFFSPSRRFFSQNRWRKKKEEEVKPTINSLTSPTQPRNNSWTARRTSGSKISDFIEPNFPSRHGSLPPPSPILNGGASGLSSRQNSIISGSGLSRITSSSSSLNLHGYLTDSAITTPTRDRQEDDADQEDSDNGDTTIIHEDHEVYKNYKTMSDFLSGLD